jgi:predicted metalloprotease with PDZ domain
MGVSIVAGLLAFQAPPAIELHVDATDGPRDLLRVTETLPATGPVVELRYPRWIPGNHRPSGPINEVIAFHAIAGGHELTWRRDPVDLYVIRVAVPDGEKQVTVKFTVGEAPGEGWSSTLGRLRWNRVVFLPPGDIYQMPVQASLTAPPKWTVQTALTVRGNDGQTEAFEPVTAERLIDSPAQLGAYAHTYEVAPGHYLDVLTQEPAEISLRPEIVDGVRRLIKESFAIFGARHYRQYHYLATFSDRAASAGLEHNECCEVGMNEKTLKGDPGLAEIGFLYCHEMFHSWNGKYRRPAGLINGDYMTAQQTELVWVYEGMTEYYGDVLAARTGFATRVQAVDQIANEISGMSTRGGRSWRSVADTAVAASILREANGWSSDRRQQDYYSESVATWLLVDSTIRRLTGGHKSLDDFCRLFEGGPTGAPGVAPYQYMDVVATLNKVALYDWDALFQRLVYAVGPEPLTEQLAAAGWRMTYNDQPTTLDAALAMYDVAPDHIGDLGLEIDKSGVVRDMSLGSPADRAGFAPAMKIVGVNSRTYSEENLAGALREAKNSSAPIEFVVERDGKLATLSVDYHGGIRRPHLERIPGSHEYLNEILSRPAGL